jgi:phage shock protein E
MRTTLFLAAGAALFGTGRDTGDQRYEDPDHLLRLINGKDEPYVLADVRTPEEYAGGHIPTAVNVPHTEIARKPPAADKTALVIVYCRSGGRSSAAKKTLERLGYTRVVNFGGISKFRGKLAP